MKKIILYQDEITGKKFESEKEARKSEVKHQQINNIFKFWEFKSEDIGRGENIQLEEELYYKLIDTIIEAINTFEPWLKEEYKEEGGLKRIHVMGNKILGRYLQDSNSCFYEWWGIQGCICPNCYRLYSQAFFAVSCNCGLEE